MSAGYQCDVCGEAKSGGPVKEVTLAIPHPSGVGHRAYIRLSVGDTAYDDICPQCFARLMRPLLDGMEVQR